MTPIRVFYVTIFQKKAKSTFAYGNKITFHLIKRFETKGAQTKLMLPTWARWNIFENIKLDYF